MATEGINVTLLMVSHKESGVDELVGEQCIVFIFKNSFETDRSSSGVGQVVGRQQVPGGNFLRLITIKSSTGTLLPARSFSSTEGRLSA